MLPGCAKKLWVTFTIQGMAWASPSPHLQIEKNRGRKIFRGLRPITRPACRSNSCKRLDRYGAAIAVMARDVGAKLPAIGGRRQTNQAAEHASEVALVAEPCFLANVRHRSFGSGEQRLGPLDPAVVQVRQERLARSTLEEAEEVRLAHPADTRRLHDSKRLPIVLIHVIE